jgi:cytochrome c-type biogenesis protein CcmH
MRYLLIILLLALPAPALAIDPDEMFADPALEARARDLGRELRCLKCRNQSIFDSNAGLAKDLRVVVRERITAGDSDRQVLDYVQARFGDYVLLKPPVAQHTYALWLTPLVLALLGGLAFALYLRRTPSAPMDMSDADRAEARAILGKES